MSWRVAIRSLKLINPSAELNQFSAFHPPIQLPTHRVRIALTREYVASPKKT